MAGTRSSARQAAAANPSPSSSAKNTPAKTAAGNKRKPDAEKASPASSKRGKKGGKKEQKTLEETMPDQDEEEAQKDVEMKEADVGGKADEHAQGKRNQLVLHETGGDWQSLRSALCKTCHTI